MKGREMSYYVFIQYLLRACLVGSLLMLAMPIVISLAASTHQDWIFQCAKDYGGITLFLTGAAASFLLKPIKSSGSC